ncbi:ABC transporter ATP-binding protein [Methylococcus capsulatus]|jgi:ABC-type lipoprotein export system ATPase subunit|uniref:ABC transporter, ATP-binding family protein n=1 Tax=Methylococcus capsulatus (strain ATCC 33009 / NCIMB 11132 / Bath) TaxID=243233 RepID=Q605V4_METCA|nr:ABC transporter ATP-binding protein [Methylococcus capsulatus]AAU91605.1 ABC transporter, ATP-binding family protein [Methylococcus capsulatus str. Bath]QXP87229.1 ABC transporter ATP-binding protein [Methylococcus capsulatus]QXP93091.1 ABC transporter ATP-binding protein [Methylococcus capsulatus]UQN12224.1 ABC transporter ATP-binding protein [Methylococcus capsulatus]
MIEIERLSFRYPGAGTGVALPALRIERGARVAIIGPSGAGKTTLLKLIAGILTPGTGTVRVDGITVSALDDDARRNFRISRIGFVFQELELLDYLSVYDNIVHPYRINRVLKLDRQVRDRARALAEHTGLGDKLAALPRELSQGERQRAAVCRALLTEPDLLLADEATGNLDPANKLRIIELLIQAAERNRATLLAVTHDHELLPLFDRVIDIRQPGSPRAE